SRASLSLAKTSPSASRMCLSHCALVRIFSASGTSADLSRLLSVGAPAGCCACAARAGSARISSPPNSGQARRSRSILRKKLRSWRSVMSMKVPPAHSARSCQLGVGFSQARREHAGDVDHHESEAVPVPLAEGSQIFGGQVEQLRVGARAYGGRAVLLVDQAHLPEELRGT